MAQLLAAASLISIAQLTPTVSSPSTRYIRAIVTLIWPYSSSNSTLKVLLAEPDFRLRRTKGQVRVQFSGSSAKTVFEAGIGSGDEIILCLAGVEWAKDESAGQTPGRSIDWELKFSERLVLKIHQNESEKTSLLDIDHPSPRPQQAVPHVVPEPEPIPSPPKPAAFKSTRPSLIRSETSEWSSPAFVKRARVSYGALFESGYDMFAEEDGTVQGVGRKRPRFSRQSGTWRYSSRSQSPEPSSVDEEMVGSGSLGLDENSKTMMTDEGCQTLEFREDNAAEALADLFSQQGSAVSPEKRSDVHQLHAPTESLELPGSSAEMLPPSIPPTSSESELRGGSLAQENLAKAITSFPQSTQSDMTPLDKSHGVTQHEPSGRVLDNATESKSAEPSVTVEVEDLYGLSPTADGYAQNDAPVLAGDPIKPPYDDVQVEFHHDRNLSPASLEGHQNSVSYPKLPDQSASTAEVVDRAVQFYPEPINDIDYRVAAQTGPYFNDESFSGLGSRSDDLHQQSDSQWKLRTEETRLSEDRQILDQMPVQKLLARHFSPAGIAMSRSRSGSEMIDLTEDSDENEGENQEGLETDEEEERKERPYQVDNLSGGEEEGYENLLYNGYGPESAESDIHCNEHTIRHPIKNLAPGEVADDEDGLLYEEDYLEEESFEEEDLEESEGDSAEEEEEDDGDDDEEDDDNDDDDEDEDGEGEDVSEEDDISHAIKQPRRGEPEIIDLLSSDGEDGEDEDREDNNASGAGSESEEGAAAKLSQNSSISVEERMSEGDTEADVGYSDGESMEGEESGEERLHETQLEQSQSDKPSIAEDLAGSLNNQKSDEQEIEYANKAIRNGANQNISSNTVEGSEQVQAANIDRGNKMSTAGDESAHHGGYDGAFDDSNGLPASSQEAGKEEIAITNTGDGASTEQLVRYPVLPAINATAEVSPLLLDRSAQFDAISKMSKNEQLPTPDATQLTEPMVLDISFGAVECFQSSSVQESLLSSNVNRMDSSPVRKMLNTTEIGDGLVSAAVLTRTTPKDAATGATIDTVENVTRAVKEESAGDVRVDTATEVISENPSGNAPNADTCIPENNAVKAVQSQPVAPRRSKRLSFTHQEFVAERSPSINMDEPTTPEDYDASVELAMAALDSPSKDDPNEYKTTEREMRVKLSRPLRTDFGDFTTLKLIRFNLEKKVDVLAIVTTLPLEPQRAKAGLRHYHLCFNITDATTPSGVVAVNLFRPYKTALPVVQPSEVVLLRSFLVKSDKGAGFALRSEEGSSWVVFKTNGEEEVRGPPVEYGDGERDHVSYLKAWYENTNTKSTEILEKANGVLRSDMERSTSKAL